MYSDDMILDGPNKTELQEILRELEKLVKENGLHKNSDKIVQMTFRRGGRAAKNDTLNLNDEPLEVVNRLKFLGITLQTTVRSFCYHIQERSAAAIKELEQPPVRTPEELWDRVLDAWKEVAKNLDLFHNLLDSMLHRIRAVVDAGLGPSQILDLIDEGDRSELEGLESEGEREERDDVLFEANNVSEKYDRVENKSSADNAEPTEENGADDADPREDNGAESGADAEYNQQPENEPLAEDEYDWMNLTSKDKIQWRRSVLFQETIPIWEVNNGGDDILDLPYPITYFSRYIPISMFEKFVEMTNIYKKGA
ncbi:uncharacterized protein [Periplaneta americana]|uniref:uncharacterized protein n=1 Tax=Periplaneta americana TaxID=6978 RepID=UPI0037E917C5